MLPTIRLGDADVTRLIIGGNPFSGNSHVSEDMSAEMENFFTTQEVKRTLFRCMECGINAMQLRADRHIMRIMREFRMEGGELHWVAQTAPELLSYEGMVRQAMAYNPVAIYHHGTMTDQLYKAGEYDEIRRRLEVLKKTGRAVGLGTHMPEVIAYAEEHGFGADFYMACVYNISREDRVSSAITGKANNGEIFDEEDVVKMYRMIRQVQKPCLAFKILGATRRCDTQEDVQAAFDQAFANIKPTDAVVVGMYPKTLDQVGLNARYTAAAIQRAAQAS